MKTRFDNQYEMVCVRDCFYAGQDFTAGRSVVLGSHPALHHLGDYFEPLTPENTPKRDSTLREQLERRANRVEENDQHAAAERVRAEQAKSRRALAREDAFWERAGELVETRVATDLPDPAAEERAEEIAEEQRIAALPEGEEEFWDQAMAHLERPHFPIGELEDPDQW